MGCGKSKHDVITGNTKTVKKPSDSESVKGKENETIKRQESCRCRKTNDRSETTVENNSKKADEKEAVGNWGETNNDDQKNEKISAPTMTAIMPENIVTEENIVPIDEQNEKVDIEETEVNNGDVDTQILSPPEDEEPKSDVQTLVTELRVEETPTTDTEIPPPQVEEPNSNVQTPVIELGVEDTLTTENDNTEIPPSEDEEPKSDQDTPATENDQVPATDNNESPVLKEEEKVDVLEENPANVIKEVESAA